jgi:RNA polymerase sigma factor (sigma-70 family)
MSLELPRLAGPVTQLLDAAACGDKSAHEQLWSLVYDELHRAARQQLAGEQRGVNLQTTVLVHEAYLRLVGNGQVHWANRRHFFAAAAKAMRRICVDDARKRERLKRGGPGLGRKNAARAAAKGGADGQGACAWHGPNGPLGNEVSRAAVFDRDPGELLALDEALAKLEKEDPAKAEIVMLRYFAGLTIEETAVALGLAPRTVAKLWRFARAWLHRELSPR